MKRISMKVCTKCKKKKSLSCFYKDRQKQGGLRYWCKDCVLENVYAWEEKNIGNLKSIIKNRDLKKLYGIGLVDYERMYNTQCGFCLICKTKKDVLCIDHNHKTGKIRGLLCNNCNRVLGSVKEDVNILSEMIDYIKGDYF